MNATRGAPAPSNNFGSITNNGVTGPFLAAAHSASLSASRRSRRNHITLVSTFAFNYGVALPKLADEVWGNEKYFGWVLAVTSFGSMLGALINARKVRITYRWVASMTIVLGVANIGLAWAPNIVVAFLWSVPLGVGGAAMISSANSITQQESPPDMRGRLLALTAVAFLGSTPIGGPVTGWVADAISVHLALAYGGIIAVVSGTAMLVWILSRHPEHDVAGAGATSQA